jgi:hypothetical protein
MTNTYSCLPETSYTHDSYLVTALRSQDIYTIMEWRNAQIDVLRQKSLLTREDQENYYKTSIQPSFSMKEPPLILFSILHKKKFIGYGGFVHIDWQSRRAEMSFLTSPQRAAIAEQYETDFTTFITILKIIGFQDLNLQRLSTETFDIRPQVIDILEKNGFVKEGRMRNHNLIQGKYIDSIIHGCLNNNKNIVAENSANKGNQQRGYNTLVTSISRKIPLLNFIRSTGNRVSESFKLFGCDSDDICLGKHFVDSFWHCPTDENLTFNDIVSYCISKDIHFIIPTRDSELQFYSDHKNEFATKDINVMISSPKAVGICLDKLLFYEFFKDIPSVPIIQTAMKPIPAMGKRVVVKERSGSGSDRIGMNLSFDAALAYSEKLSSPVFQPYIEGKEYSIDLYVSSNSEVVGTVVRSRDFIVAGESQITTIARNPELEEICRRAAEALRLQGHVIFQALIDRNN